MKWEERIVAEPDVLIGKPVIKGTRLSIEFIVALCHQGWSIDDVTANYPTVTREDVLACLSYGQQGAE